MKILDINNDYKNKINKKWKIIWLRLQIYVFFFKKYLRICKCILFYVY